MSSRELHDMRAESHKQGEYRIAQHRFAEREPLHGTSGAPDTDVFCNAIQVKNVLDQRFPRSLLSRKTRLGRGREFEPRGDLYFALSRSLLAAIRTSTSNARKAVFRW